MISRPSAGRNEWFGRNRFRGCSVVSATTEEVTMYIGVSLLGLILLIVLLIILF
jgi:hypothetical protein